LGFVEKFVEDFRVPRRLNHCPRYYSECNTRTGYALIKNEQLMGANTGSNFSSRAVAFMPMLFVLLWSTGFIIAKFGLPFAPPLTFLLLRFSGVLIVLIPLALMIRARWPVGKIGAIAVAGVLMQAGYLGGVWCAIKIGMPAGLSALIVGMQPILTAFAAPIIGESVRRRQWIGLMMGLSGVALVVGSSLKLSGLTWDSITLCLMALASITVGTLYQKKHCAHFDLRTGTIIQFAASLLVMLPFAIYFEHFNFTFASVEWNASFIGSLLWSVFVLSIASIFLLFALLRKSAATNVTSLMYLTPPTTAVMAWLIFGEALSLVGVLGMLTAVIGVYFVVKK
jgi:drug/metabolite transporter (DMT)-like permease